MLSELRALFRIFQSRLGTGIENVYLLWNEGVPSFLLCASLSCVFQKVGRRECTTF